MARRTRDRERGGVLYGSLGRALGRLLVALAVLGAPIGSAWVSGYLPLTPTELGRRFPLKRSGELDEDSPTLEFRGANARFDEASREVMVQGHDRAAVGWSVSFYAGMGCSVFQADLDADGQTDFVFACPTGGCGMATPFVLNFILFDAGGRPVPWGIAGYSEVDEAGVVDLRDVDGAGHASLVQMRHEAGYWVTSAYRADRAQWSATSRTRAGRKLPLFTRYTFRPQAKAVAPAGTRRPFVQDWGSEPVGAAHRLQPSCQVEGTWNPFRTEDEAGCEPAGFVVLDEPGGRWAGSNPERVSGLLRRIAAERLAVRFSGQTEEKKCRPVTVWATDPAAESPSQTR